MTRPLFAALGAFVITSGAILGFGLLAGFSPAQVSAAPAGTPPPAGFVAGDYSDLSALSGTDGIAVTRLDDAGAYFEHYYLSAQRVAYVSLLTETGTTFVFVGADGRIIGRVAGSALTYPLANFFVDMDSYAEVTAETVSEMRPYAIIEGDPSPEDMRRYRDESTLYRQFFAYSYGAARPEYAAKLTVHVMLHDGVWKRAATSSDAILEWKTGIFESLERQSLQADPETPGFSGGKYRLRRVYFDQQEYFAGRGAVIGSPTGGSVPEYWRGTGFYELQAGDRVLKFALRDDVLNLSGWGPVRLSVLGRDGLDYVLLEASGRMEDDKTIFLVTVK